MWIPVGVWSLPISNYFQAIQADNLLTILLMPNFRQLSNIALCKRRPKIKISLYELGLDQQTELQKKLEKNVSSWTTIQIEKKLLFSTSLSWCLKMPGCFSIKCLNKGETGVSKTFFEIILHLTFITYLDRNPGNKCTRNPFYSIFCRFGENYVALIEQYSTYGYCSALLSKLWAFRAM